MEPYKEMYYKLFNAVTDAIGQLMRLETENAAWFTWAYCKIYIHLDLGEFLTLFMLRFAYWKNRHKALKYNFMFCTYCITILLLCQAFIFRKMRKLRSLLLLCARFAFPLTFNCGRKLQVCLSCQKRGRQTCKRFRSQVSIPGSGIPALGFAQK